MSGNFNSAKGVKVKMVAKSPKGASAPKAIEKVPSNAEADKLAKALFAGLLTASSLLVGGGLYWSGSNLMQDMMQPTVNWAAAAFYFVMTAGILFFATRLIWLSFLGAIMFATQKKAWETAENLCRQSLKMEKLFQGNTYTTGIMLLQSLLTRGEVDEAIQLGEKFYEKGGPKNAQFLASMCTMLGMAYQLQGSFKQASTWTERGIESFQKVLEEISTGKGFVNKLIKQTQPNMAADVHMQLCMAHYNNAAAYMNQMNYRSAKHNFKLCLEHANKAPNTPEKQQVVESVKQNLGRLKHN